MRAALLLMLAVPVLAADLRISFPALERLLGQEVFSQEGRRYFRGSAKQKCDFAYLEQPHISSKDGRLVIRARFSGRSAVDVFGRCIGLGDAFDLTMTGTPAFDRGALTIKSVGVEVSEDTFYTRRVKKALAASMDGQLRYDVSTAAKKMLTVPPGSGPYTTEVKDFHVPAVRVDADAVVLEIQFVLNVK
jgi:hypothetical protein